MSLTKEISLCSVSIFFIEIVKSILLKFVLFFQKFSWLEPCESSFGYIAYIISKSFEVEELTFVSKIIWRDMSYMNNLIVP